MKYDVFIGEILNSKERVITISCLNTEVKYFTMYDEILGNIDNIKIECKYIPKLLNEKRQKVKEIFDLIKEFAVIYGGL